MDAELLELGHGPQGLLPPAEPDLGRVSFSSSDL